MHAAFGFGAVQDLLKTPGHVVAAAQTDVACQGDEIARTISPDRHKEPSFFAGIPPGAAFSIAEQEDFRKREGKRKGAAETPRHGTG